MFLAFHFLSSSLSCPPPLHSLYSFDKDNIDVNIIKRIRGTFIDNPEFQPDKIKTVSSAAYGLCCWVRAMEAYDRVAKVVGPKKQKLGEAEVELEVVMSALRTKQAELKAVMDKLAALDADLQVKGGGGRAFPLSLACMLSPASRGHGPTAFLFASGDA